MDWAVELSKDVRDGRAIVDKVRQLIDEVEAGTWSEAKEYFLTMVGYHG